MNLEYLKNELLPQRKKEIAEGLNAATRQPIYVVLDLQENFIEGHTDYTFTTNYKHRKLEYGYVDLSLEFEDREFKVKRDSMKIPERITKFYTDRIIAFFLTKKGAEDYLKYQSHNLSDPYIYAFHSGYANKEMDNLLFNRWHTKTQ